MSEHDAPTRDARRRPEPMGYTSGTRVVTASSRLGMDKRRFERLWLRCASHGEPSLAEDCFAEVQRHYMEPHRRYHTPDHIVHCLGQFDDARGEMRDPDAVELAIWYHDVIYDVGAPDNELESARLFRRRAHGVMPNALLESVHALIMVTVHHSKRPATDDQGFMVDIDLSSFGLPWEQFLRDSVAVREEFPHLTDAMFYPRQRDFLAGLLEREYFCFTPFFRARHEARARSNIERYLTDLTARGLI